MARWVTVQEASAALGVSQDTIKRRLRAGTMPGRKEPMEKGERWLVELGDDVPLATAVPSQDESPALREIIDLLKNERAELWQEVASRRREVEELHILLQRSNEQVRLLAMPGQSNGTASAPVSAEPAQDPQSQTKAAMAAATSVPVQKPGFLKRLFGAT